MTQSQIHTLADLFSLSHSLPFYLSIVINNQFPWLGFIGHACHGHISRAQLVAHTRPQHDGGCLGPTTALTSTNSCAIDPICNHSGHLDRRVRAIQRRRPEFSILSVVNQSCRSEDS